MAIKYGLTAEGFKRKRLPEIVKSLNDRVADKLGIEIQTGANSLFGQLHGVYAYEINNLWQCLEDCYNAMYPPTAQGVQLSNAAALAGIFQIGAEKTSLICTCYGTDGAVVPYGAKIMATDLTGAVFSCVDPAYDTSPDPGSHITSDRACDVGITLPDVTAGATCIINLDGTTYSYTVASGDDVTAVMTALSAQLSFDDRSISVTNGVLSIIMNDQSQTFSVAVSGGLTISRLGSPFHFLCDTRGAIEPALGAVTTIVTQVAGWDSVTNNVPANVGREAETDIALRQRWSRSVYGRSYSMTDSIAAAIYETTGVTVVKVYENTGDVTDQYGRPPHSVEAVVMGGDPQTICNTIFRKKSAGIDTYGEISRVVYDSQGIPHTIFYNEPQDVKVWLRVEVTTDDHEEGEQFGGLQNVRQAILDAGADYEIGQDVIIQKFYGPIYRAVTGIGYVSITATTGDTPGSYSASNIVIDPRHKAVFDSARIEVVAT